MWHFFRKKSGGVNKTTPSNNGINNAMSNHTLYVYMLAFCALFISIYTLYTTPSNADIKGKFVLVYDKGDAVGLTAYFPLTMDQAYHNISKEYGIDYCYIKATVIVESSGIINAKGYAADRNGNFARGLTQIKYDTAQQYKCKDVSTPQDLYNPHTNLHCFATIYKGIVNQLDVSDESNGENLKLITAAYYGGIGSVNRNPPAIKDMHKYHVDKVVAEYNECKSDEVNIITEDLIPTH